jgi:hypothetical protein
MNNNYDSHKGFHRCGNTFIYCNGDCTNCILIKCRTHTTTELVQTTHLTSSNSSDSNSDNKNKWRYHNV